MWYGTPGVPHDRAMEDTVQTPDTPTELRATLAAIGATPSTVAMLLTELDEAALRYAAPGGRCCLDLLDDLVTSSLHLGSVAHDVLGHAPGAGSAAPGEESARPTAEMVQTRLRFLREHIVSTVDQQGVAVWSHPTPAGRPLFAHAVDLQRDDAATLAELRRAVAAARSAYPITSR